MKNDDKNFQKELEHLTDTLPLALNNKLNYAPDKLSTIKEYKDVEKFKVDLEHLINKHSIENGSNTPDFIIAEYLINCLLNYNDIIRAREEYYKK
ncbi:hypothetical protein M0Q50_10285 [bacterium]|jgi:hypothetical protein|nr:hypothetical protein [bacterium]